MLGKTRSCKLQVSLQKVPQNSVILFKNKTDMMAFNDAMF